MGYLGQKTRGRDATGDLIPLTETVAEGIRAAWVLGIKELQNRDGNSDNSRVAYLHSTCF